jgi:peptidylprolyl isomerase
LIPLLASLLSDPDPDVRTAAAFASGQMNFMADSVQRRAISASLSSILVVEKDQHVLLRLIEAMGKTGDPASLAALVERAAGTSSTSLRGEIALSVARYAYRGIKSPAATSLAAAILGGGDRNEKWKGAYALFRIGEKDLLERHTRQIREAASDDDPNVRMFLAPVLGKVLPATDTEPLVKFIGFDPDWRVRVNAVKALASMDVPASSRATGVLVKAIGDFNEHVSLAAIAAAGAKDGGHFDLHHPVSIVLRQVISDDHGGYSARQRREAAICFAKLHARDAYDILAASLNTGTLLKNAYVEALAFIPGENVLRELVEYAGQGNPETQRLALEAMSTVAKSLHPERPLLDAARASFRDGLSSGDPAVMTTAAGALSESLFADPSSIPYLIAALQRLNSSGDAEAMAAIIHSLGALKAANATSTLTTLLTDTNGAVAKEAAAALETISGVSSRHVFLQARAPVHTNFDWALLDWVRNHPAMSVKTSRGTFTVSMLPDEAPFTCVNFASLIRKGFFDGLTFHRVVPNFVIQGGDPHGDGWGGPGYTIRSEFGYVHYER